MNNLEQLLYNYYLEDNYEIVNLDKNKGNVCYIFFSSYGLYKGRDDVEALKQMHETNRYEWKYIASNKRITKIAKKIIFLRDILKIFYIKGINNKINSIDKIRELLIKETNGMDVILAGSSAGAYMALLLGNMLPNTCRVITIGGVVDLNNFRSFSSYLDDIIDKCDYVDISNYLYRNYWIINFYGIDNVYDKHSAELLNNYSNNERLINVGFRSNEHAPRPTGEDLIKLLICSENHLQTVMNKVKKHVFVNKRLFSHINLGPIHLCCLGLRNIVVKVLRK